MIQDLTELKSWMDIKDAEISSAELDLLNNYEAVKDEIETMFKFIAAQLAEGIDMSTYYLVKPSYYKQFYPDFYPKLEQVYYDKLTDIYDNILMEYFNLSFYKGKDNDFLDNVYKHFEVFYSLTCGTLGYQKFSNFFINKTALKNYRIRHWPYFKNNMFLYFNTFYKLNSKLIETLNNFLKKPNQKMLSQIETLFKISTNSNPTSQNNTNTDNDNKLDNIKQFVISLIDQLTEQNYYLNNWMESIKITPPKSILKFLNTTIYKDINQSS